MPTKNTRGLDHALDQAGIAAAERRAQHRLRRRIQYLRRLRRQKDIAVYLLLMLAVLILTAPFIWRAL